MDLWIRSLRELVREGLQTLIRYYPLVFGYGLETVDKTQFSHLCLRNN